MPDAAKQNGDETNVPLPLKVLDSVDASMLNSFRDLQQPDEPDLITELIDLFLKDAAEQIALLEKADITKTKFIKESAHKLKGTSGNVGALQMAALSGRLEENFADFEKARILTAEMKSEFENVSRILNDMRKND